MQTETGPLGYHHTQHLQHPMTPRFVYFDLDDTILDHRKAEKSALADLRASFDELKGVDKKIMEDVYHAGNVVYWKQYASGEITKAQVRRLRFEHLLKALEIDAMDPTEIGEFYMERYALYWDYCEGAREGFFNIADRFPVGVLTNGFAKVQRKKLAQFSELRDQLDAVVVSEEFGHMKPHPKLFAHAAKLANTSPQDILYIGDSMTSDVEGGQNAGWNVIWYAPEEENPPADVVHAKSWAEVTELLS